MKRYLSGPTHTDVLMPKGGAKVPAERKVDIAELGKGLVLHNHRVQ
jgi:hypothetical protein